jgi:Protein of unknown function (DUF429)
VIAAGVDLSSQATNTTTCVVQWSDARASVSDLQVGVSDNEITALMGAGDKLGIDVPLGWPIAFVGAVSEHSRTRSWRTSYSHSDTSTLRLRRTDLWPWCRFIPK